MSLPNNSETIGPNECASTSEVGTNNEVPRSSVLLTTDRDVFFPLGGDEPWCAHVIQTLLGSVYEIPIPQMLKYPNG